MKEILHRVISDVEDLRYAAYLRRVRRVYRSFAPTRHRGTDASGQLALPSGSWANCTLTRPCPPQNEWARAQTKKPLPCCIARQRLQRLVQYSQTARTDKSTQLGYAMSSPPGLFSQDSVFLRHTRFRLTDIGADDTHGADVYATCKQDADGALVAARW